MFRASVVKISLCINTHPYLATALPPPALSSSIPRLPQHEGVNPYLYSDVRGITTLPRGLQAAVGREWQSSEWEARVRELDKGECYFPLPTRSPEEPPPSA